MPILLGLQCVLNRDVIDPEESALGQECNIEFAKQAYELRAVADAIVISNEAIYQGSNSQRN